MGEKIRITGKRIDHLERAYRREEMKHLPEDFEAQRQKDLAAFEKSRDETLQSAETKHKEDVALKHRLSRLVSTYETFKRSITDQRHADFEKRRKAAERELNQKMEQRRRDAREQKAAERRRQEEEERQRREEEERQLREAEEAEQAAEEKRRKDAEAKADAEKRRAERDEAARKQREREEEAEKRRQERKMGGGGAAAGSAPSRGFDRADARPSFEGARRPAVPEEQPAAAAGGPPRLALSGASGKPSWRDREAARAAGGAGTSPAPPVERATPSPQPPQRAETPDDSAAPKRSGYIPPALRGKAPGAESSMPPRSDSRDVAGAGGDRWQRRAPAAEGGERSESPAAPGGAYRPPGSRTGGASGGGGGAYKPPGRR